MMDLIRRQDAIDEIKALYEWHDTVTEDRVVDHLKRLPSAQQWIPCSERLPEKDGDYLAFAKWDIDEDFSVQIIPFDSCLEKFGVWREYINPFSLGFEGSELIEAEEVKAWMPLPERWEGENDESL